MALTPRKERWLAIEQAYIEGDDSYAKLALAWDVSAESIARHGTRGAWRDKRARWREERDLEQRVLASEAPEPAHTSGEVGETLDEMCKRHHRLFEQALVRAIAMLTDVTVVRDDDGKPLIHTDEHGREHIIVERVVSRPKDVRDIMSAIKDGVAGQRQARGMADPKPGEQQEDATTTKRGVIELPALDPPPVPPSVEG